MKDQIIALILANIKYLPSSSILGVEIGSRHLSTKKTISQSSLLELYDAIINSSISFLIKSSRNTFSPEEFDDFLGSHSYSEGLVYLCTFLEANDGSRLFTISSPNGLVKLERISRSEVVYTESTTGGVTTFAYSGDIAGDFSIQNGYRNMLSATTSQVFSFEVIRSNGAYAVGSFSLGGTPLVSDTIDSVTVDGVELLSGPVTCTANLFSTARLVAAAINLNTDDTDIRAESDRQSIFLYSTIIGADYNGLAVLATKTGDITVGGYASTAGGVDPDEDNATVDQLEVSLLTDPSITPALAGMAIDYDSVIPSASGEQFFNVTIIKPTTVSLASAQIDFLVKGCGKGKKFTMTLTVV